MINVRPREEERAFRILGAAVPAPVLRHGNPREEEEAAGLVNGPSSGGGKEAEGRAGWSKARP